MILKVGIVNKSIDDNIDLIQEIETQLDELSDPERLEWAKKNYATSMILKGVTVPNIRPIVKELNQRFKKSRPEEEVEFADRSALRDLTTRIELLLRKLKDSFQLGNAIKNGIPVAIIGETNVGKSTLLNALLNEDKAIVSDIHGTTRFL